MINILNNSKNEYLNEYSKKYFIDTETDTNGEYNKVFCIFYTEADEIDKQFNMIKENNKRIDRVKFIFFLEYCLDKLLNNIQDKSLIYFNNLNYIK